MNGRLHATGGGHGEDVDRHVRVLQAAYDRGSLLVSGDLRALEQARREHGHAIDARDVADAMLRALLTSTARRQG